MEYEILLVSSFLFMFSLLVLIAKVMDKNIKEKEFNKQLERQLWKNQK